MCKHVTQVKTINRIAIFSVSRASKGMKSIQDYVNSMSKETICHATCEAMVTDAQQAFKAMSYFDWDAILNWAKVSEI